MIQAGIVGATGYVGAELLRLLARHPDIEPRLVTSQREAGHRVDAVWPQFRGMTDLAFSHPDDADLADCELVFFATPNGTAMQRAPELLERGVRVVDLSADFRLRDPVAYPRWYDVEHPAPQLLAEAVYGLPEINGGQLRDARLVAAPGCYPTAVQLGLWPLLENRAVDTGSLVADCKSGVSGAGRALRTRSLFVESSDTFSAYGVDGHRHQPEIEQGLALAAGGPVGLTFVPHLVPMNRGLHATLHAALTTDADVQALFERRYATSPFVDVLPPGSHPDTRSVRGSNTCRIAVHRVGDGRRVVVLSVIDNLTKGAAGQAVQCANRMFGQDETAGLHDIALSP